MKEFWIHFLHVFFISGFLAYIGIMKTKMPTFLFIWILVIGIFIIAYHIYKSLFKKDAWINYIHILIIGPLLVYIGFMKEETPKKVFEIILMLAFASIGYHGYYMLST
jgi:hypothetical protein